MIKLNKPLCTLLLCLTQSVWAQSKLPLCQGDEISKWTNCFSAVDYESGSKYIGEFKKGMPDGQGAYETSDGVKYTGQFKAGQRSGRGVSTSSDGASYDGQWLNGSFNGQGTFIYSDGTKYVGQWKNGQQDGQGTLTYPQGSYSGQWKDSKRNGYGVATLKSGGGYAGQWKNGAMDGKGTLTDENGAKLIGVWANGELVKDESPKPPPAKIITLACVPDGGKLGGLEFQYFIDVQKNSVIASRGVTPSNISITPTLITFNQDSSNVSINRVSGKFTLVVGSTIASGACQLLDQAKPKF